MFRRAETMPLGDRSTRQPFFAMHSQAIQDYVKTIYALGGEHESVSTNDLAEALRVAPASVTGMIRRLQGLELVTHEPYRGVRLTETGRLLGVEMIRHHRLLELFLHKMLGMPLEQVHDEAERLEHVISEEFEARIDALMGYPSHDPHGSPIPTAALEVDPLTHRPLHACPVGTYGIVVEVADRNPDTLRDLASLGMLPNTQFRVVERTARGMAIELVDRSPAIWLSEPLVASIFVHTHHE